MSKSLALLEWKDIQSLLRLSAMTYERKDPLFAELEACRQELIPTFLTYLEQWLPGREIENDLRRPLIAALQKYADLLRKAIIVDLEEGEANSPWQESYGECLRIKLLLETAIVRSEPAESGSAG